MVGIKIKFCLRFCCYCFFSPQLTSLLDVRSLCSVLDGIGRSGALLLEHYLRLRRPPIVVSFVVCGCSMLLSMCFTDKTAWPVSILVVLGISSATFCFNLVWVFAAELYPTPIR